jgi:ATP-dependent exoDNAse (exonuclease V) beta subunit
MAQMSKAVSRALPPDQDERIRALDPTRSILVQAPAGSGKTDLLTRRFLRLLSQVEDPGEIVAITFTNAAAAEMRHRILSELEKARKLDQRPDSVDEFSIGTLAKRALDRSRTLGWQLPDLSAQLRITTIDSFCRDLAIQQPLVSGFGGDLKIHEQPADLYRRAARRTLLRINGENPELIGAIRDLLLWRDNNWRDLENQLVEMLEKRDRWMHDFVLDREPDWNALRERLERPFHEAVTGVITDLCSMLATIPGACAEAMLLARFACEQTGGKLHRDLAELSDLPTGPFKSGEELEEARVAFLCLARMVLTEEGIIRRRFDRSNGFPADCHGEKLRIERLVADMSSVDGLEVALRAVRSLPPTRYTEDDWRIVRACFTLLRQAAGELRTVFAEVGAIDFVEVAQIAQRVLTDEGGLPSDAAIALADGIRHLLVDETQDTSRRQHRMLGSLAAAWPDQNGRTIFVVGDPLQSIYFFRDADTELFLRLRDWGLDIPESAPLPLDLVRLTANFRTEPALVDQLNKTFADIFDTDDGSGIKFASALPARDPCPEAASGLKLHVGFMLQPRRAYSMDPAEATQDKEVTEKRAAARNAQVTEIVALIEEHLTRIEAAKRSSAKYRVAVLGRTRAALVPIAMALRAASIPFRAVELEQLKDRPEVVDALALGHALLNPFDRIAWLSVLRAPWCGLSLADLLILTSADDKVLLRRPVADLLAERLHLVGQESRISIERILRTMAAVPRLRVALPTASLGTWLEQVWLSLGGASCVDPGAQANLDLLWNCLDSLPNGGQDMLGPALDSALEKLTALPTPTASSDCGVQLMTIHKSKGLEFEVVIVPELQATGNTTREKMLSWLERGLTVPDLTGEVTEFLVAPLQSKGIDRSKTKTWVDRVYQQRERQEMRRILYVAATRAREELHLFARVEYKNHDGVLTLVEPNNCLLATAWPAFEAEVSARFDQWRSAQSELPHSGAGTPRALAAPGNGNLIILPSPAKPTFIRRLPADFDRSRTSGASPSMPRQTVVGSDDGLLYARHEGGALSRALGSAVHKLLEELAGLRTTLDWNESSTALANALPRIKAQVRAIGASQSETNSIANQALDYTLAASRDPIGRWILSPHANTASEAAWVGVAGGTLRSVRIDRVFRAGSEPLTESGDAWWIIDYKTAHADDLGPLSALSDLRTLFAPQLEAYAMVLRNLHGKDARIIAGLYYPRMPLLDWWEVK